MYMFGKKNYKHVIATVPVEVKCVGTVAHVVMLHNYINMIVAVESRNTGTCIHGTTDSAKYATLMYKLHSCTI